MTTDQRFRAHVDWIHLHIEIVQTKRRTARRRFAINEQPQRNELPVADLTEDSSYCTQRSRDPNDITRPFVRNAPLLLILTLLLYSYHTN